MEAIKGVIIVGFFMNVKLSVQLKSSHPLHGLVERINGEGGPYIGLLMAYPTEETVLLDCGLFVPSSNIPWVDLAGTPLSLSTCFFFIGNIFQNKRIPTKGTSRQGKR